MRSWIKGFASVYKPDLQNVVVSGGCDGDITLQSGFHIAVFDHVCGDLVHREDQVIRSGMVQTGSLRGGLYVLSNRTERVEGTRKRDGVHPLTHFLSALTDAAPAAIKSPERAQYRSRTRRRRSR